MRRKYHDTQARRIGICLNPAYGYCRDVILGASEACVEKGVWKILANPHFVVPELVRDRKLRGMIAMAGNEDEVKRLRGLGVPVVNVSGRMETPEMPQVLPDNMEVGRMGARHLLAASVRTVGFVGDDAVFSDRRNSGFAEEMKRAGRVWKSALEFVNFAAFLKWLVAAPKPVGVFVISDLMAAGVVRDAQELGLRIPEDLSVVSVDNDRLICLTQNPPLTSVNCNFVKVGALAVDLLVKWIEQGKAPPAETLVAPAGVVVRQTSNLVATGDEVVNTALQIIRERAPQGLTVKELVDQLVISRRGLELRFQDALGRTPAMEIVRAKVQRARQLLGDTELPVARVVEAAGFANHRQMRAVFQRELGISPMEYRLNNRGV